MVKFFFSFRLERFGYISTLIVHHIDVREISVLFELILEPSVSMIGLGIKEIVFRYIITRQMPARAINAMYKNFLIVLCFFDVNIHVVTVHFQRFAV